MCLVIVASARVVVLSDGGSNGAEQASPTEGQRRNILGSERPELRPFNITITALHKTFPELKHQGPWRIKPLSRIKAIPHNGVSVATPR